MQWKIQWKLVIAIPLSIYLKIQGKFWDTGLGIQRFFQNIFNQYGWPVKSWSKFKFGWFHVYWYLSWFGANIKTEKKLVHSGIFWKWLTGTISQMSVTSFQNSLWYSSSMRQTGDIFWQRAWQICLGIFSCTWVLLAYCQDLTFYLKRPWQQLNPFSFWSSGY